MPKRILVYLYYYAPYENANTNVVLPLLDGLKQKYDVTVYTIDIDGGQPTHETLQKINIIRDTRSKQKFSRFVHMVYDSRPENVSGSFRPLKGLILRVFHRLISKQGLERLLPDKSLQYYQKILAAGYYDALITVTAPITTQYETLPLAAKGKLARWNTRWFPYFTDPHATFVGHADQFDALMSRELEIYAHADAVFTSKELYEDNKNTPLGRFTNKTIPIQFANLRQLSSTQTIPYLQKGKINCVYIGSLFSIVVRNPEYFYQLAQRCGDDFYFHIVCYAADEENEKLREQYVDANPHFMWHPRASLQECHSLMCQADIMINLGNRCLNQTPSKIFDYMASGKPIVNFYSLPGDTAKHYLQRYPLKLNVLESEALSDENTEAFETFCRKNAGQALPFEAIEELYPDCSTQTLKKQFVSKIDALLNA